MQRAGEPLQVSVFHTPRRAALMQIKRKKLSSWRRASGIPAGRKSEGTCLPWTGSCHAGRLAGSAGLPASDRFSGAEASK